MPVGKWIVGTSPEQPVAEAARRVLQVRTCEVDRLLRLAALRADENVEYVHQLRVATRRALAAVKVFRDLLRRRSRRWAHKQLRRVRQSAGDARDFDVLRTRCDGEHSAVIGRLRELRRDAQLPLVELHDKWQRKRWTQRLEAIAHEPHWRDRGRSPTFAQVGRRQLRLVLRKFLRAGRADFSDVRALHAFRIAGKHLRYTMEIFAGAMASEFRQQLYPQMEDIQERLGRVNDHAVAAQKLLACGEALDHESAQRFHELALREEAQLQHCCEEFRRWWTPERADTLRKQFLNHLKKSERP